VGPTREQAILDLVLCNEVGLINDLIVQDAVGKSDPNMPECQIECEGEELETYTSVLGLNKGNHIDMRTDLTLVDWAGRLQLGQLMYRGRCLRRY